MALVWRHLQPAQICQGQTTKLRRFNKPTDGQVPLFYARVQVSLRPSVLDPAGEATRAAAARLGVSGVRRLRIGKAVDLELEATDRGEAQRQLELLSDRLLANPVIEDWSLEICEAGGPEA
jgi:phosphoribosylformylglycinamidine synthase subunit PurS